MSKTDVNFTGREPQRKRGELRRQAILEGALRIIGRVGIRGVKHRAVAQEAGVPLAATTYYFKDINDLITDAFLLFAQRSQSIVDQLISSTTKQLSDPRVNALSAEQRTQMLISQIGALSERYIVAQVKGREERQIEHTFKSEALRNPAVAKVMQSREQERMVSIETLLTKLGSPSPADDAIMVDALYLHLEYSALLKGSERVARKAIRQTIEHIASYLIVASD